MHTIMFSSKRHAIFLYLIPVCCAELFQPLRKLEARGKSVPFYTCGDQQQSCDAFGQPVSMLNRLFTRDVSHIFFRISAVQYQCPASTLPLHLTRFSAANLAHLEVTVVQT